MFKTLDLACNNLPWRVVKVRKFQNKNMKSSHCPKYQRKNLKNSVLSIQGRILHFFFFHILGNATTSYLHYDISWPLRRHLLLPAASLKINECPIILIVVPVVKIEGGPDIHAQAGSSVTLKCSVIGALKKPTSVKW